MRRRWTMVGGAISALVVVLAGALVGVHVYRDHHRTDLQRAIALAPGDSQRYSWTDWSGVRRTLHADLDSRSQPRDLARFLSRGFDQDLTSSSALVESAKIMLLDYGFSPANLDWEMFSQAQDGAVLIMHLPQSADFTDISDRLGLLHYQRPARGDGIWAGGEDLVSSIGDGTVSEELQYISLDRADGLVIASDSQDYLTGLLEKGLGSDRPDQYVEQAVDASGEPLSAAIYSGDYTCTALSMTHADADDQSAAAQEILRAGKINPVLGFAMSVQPDRSVRVALAFETHDQARTNADTRGVLARGPALGQGGSFKERFELGRVEAADDVVTMALEPTQGSYLLSDLSTGPLIFATC